MENHFGIGIENLVFAEDLYESWKVDPGSVPEEWASLFEEMPPDDGVGVAHAARSHAERANEAVRQEPPGAARGAPGSAVAKIGSDQDYKNSYVYKQGRVESLIWAYRDVGYLYADVNPLHGYLPPELEYLAKTVEGTYGKLEPEGFGLTNEDLDTV